MVAPGVVNDSSLDTVDDGCGDVEVILTVVVDITSVVTKKRTNNAFMILCCTNQ